MNHSPKSNQSGSLATAGVMLVLCIGAGFFLLVWPTFGVLFAIATEALGFLVLRRGAEGVERTVALVCVGVGIVVLVAFVFLAKGGTKVGIGLGLPF